VNVSALLVFFGEIWPMMFSLDTKSILWFRWLDDWAKDGLRISTIWDSNSLCNNTCCGISATSRPLSQLRNTSVKCLPEFLRCFCNLVVCTAFVRFSNVPFWWL
jgi:hypothetical protein